MDQNYVMCDIHVQCFLESTNGLLLLLGKAGKGLNLSAAYLKVK